MSINSVLLAKQSSGHCHHGNLIECQRHCWKRVIVCVMELCGSEYLLQSCIPGFIHSFCCFGVSTTLIVFNIIPFLRLFYSARADQLILTAVNPDALSSPWSRNAQLRSIGLLYRHQSTSAWTRAVNADGSNVTFPYQVAIVCVHLIVMII